ncbi:Protein of unknown function [Pyronema omphalodes CBS 100304]|uniref:Uncharacterized protein n=1 Tax=Pyronema omphalodes (strain CBS 100304) TaxID=1076935 RepID=U4LGJ6_PYROM|nr:Protein of unknown function [Pyronema omphalodes CBS 100304]
MEHLPAYPRFHPTAHPYHLQSGASTAPSGYLIPIDPRLLEIDAHQRAARGLVPFTPKTMALPFAPLVATGPQTAGVLAPGASSTALVKRKRA